MLSASRKMYMSYYVYYNHKPKTFWHMYCTSEGLSVFISVFYVTI